MKFWSKVIADEIRGTNFWDTLYSSFGRNKDVYAISLTFQGQFQRLHCIIPLNDLWADHLSLLLMVQIVTPRYGKLPTCSNSTLQKTYFRWGGLFLCKMVTILHLEGLNLQMILPRFKPAYSVGQIKESHKPYHLQQCRKVGHRLQKYVTDDCTLSGSLLLYNKKGNGLRTVPQRMPEVTGHWRDVWPSQTTDWKHCVRKDSTLNSGADLGFRSAAASLGVACEGPLAKSKMTTWKTMLTVC